MFLLTVQSWICSQSVLLSLYMPFISFSFMCVSPLSCPLCYLFTSLPAPPLSSPLFCFAVFKIQFSCFYPLQKQLSFPCVGVSLQVCQCFAASPTFRVCDKIICFCLFLRPTWQKSWVLILYRPFELIASGSMAWLRVDTSMRVCIFVTGIRDLFWYKYSAPHGTKSWSFSGKT